MTIIIEDESIALATPLTQLSSYLCDLSVDGGWNSYAISKFHSERNEDRSSWTKDEMAKFSTFLFSSPRIWKSLTLADLVNYNTNRHPKDLHDHALLIYVVVKFRLILGDTVTLTDIGIFSYDLLYDTDPDEIFHSDKREKEIESALYGYLDIINKDTKRCALEQGVEKEKEYGCRIRRRYDRISYQIWWLLDYLHRTYNYNKYLGECQDQSYHLATFPSILSLLEYSVLSPDKTH